MKRNTLLHLLFAVLVIIELAGRFVNKISLEYPVKPLIMIWIAVYFILNRQKKDFTVPVLFAFFFSWVGDILLMLSGKNELLFYAGVGGFFFAQLFYIYTFTVYPKSGNKGFVQKHPILIFIFLAYLAGIYGFLFADLDGIMKPVILVYAISLIAMSVMALNRRDRIHYRSFIFVFLGSILFVISDSMIAINKFHSELPMAGFSIMVTYISAQYLIMRGLILEK